MALNKEYWMDLTNYTGKTDEIPDYPIFEGPIKKGPLPDYAKYFNSSHSARGAKAKSCSLHDHAYCVSVIIKNFNYTSCLACNGKF